MFRKRHQNIGLGGTFDHFHAGHQHFIEFAAALGEHLFIGITNEKLNLHKPLTHLIEPYGTRLQAVRRFCGEKGIANHCVELTDIYGPTLEGSHIDALCVTPETEAGGKKINQMRERLRMRQLPIYVCDYLLDASGAPLHAENIRAGKVNRQGEVYDSIFDQDFILSPEQRTFFSQPQGELINLERFPTKATNHQLRLVVGDSSLETFIQKGWRYDLGVFDHRRQRQPFESTIIDQLPPDNIVTNPAGTISQELVTTLQKALNQPFKHLAVDGEEDLAAVALVLLTPLETEIFYGQPGKGIICMQVDEELKDAAYDVLKD